MDYATFVEQLALVGDFDGDEEHFLAEVPVAITYAEKRIYRDLQLLDATISDTSLATTPNTRSLSITGVERRFIVIDRVNVFTPAGADNPEEATRNPLTRTALAYIDFVYPSSASAGQPVHYALLDNQSIIFGPWPDSAYQIEIVGTYRPEELSAANPTTLLTDFFPDLLLAAALVHLSAFMRNFGAQSDNPQMAMSWETQYQTLLASAAVEEARKKAMGV